jgi:hypothetical protein
VGTNKSMAGTKILLIFREDSRPCNRVPRPTETVLGVNRSMLLC